MPSLRAVDELCRLALAARRLGCRVRLEGASDELRSMLDLAGVDGLLLDERAEPAPSTNATEET